MNRFGGIYPCYQHYPALEAMNAKTENKIIISKAAARYVFLTFYEVIFLMPVQSKALDADEPRKRKILERRFGASIKESEMEKPIYKGVLTIRAFNAKNIFHWFRGVNLLKVEHGINGVILGKIIKNVFNVKGIRGSNYIIGGELNGWSVENGDFEIEEADKESIGDYIQFIESHADVFHRFVASVKRKRMLLPVVIIVVVVVLLLILVVPHLDEIMRLLGN